MEGIDKWKFASFDKIRRLKSEMMRRLESIQNKLQIHDNVRGMRKLELQLQKELAIF